MQVPSRSGFRAESALPHHPLRVSFSPDSAFPTEATPQAAETSPAAEVTESSKSLSAMLRRTPSEKGFMPLLSGSSVSLGAQWRQIDEQRHERRVPCRLRRVARLLSWLLGLLILLTIVQELLFWAFSSHACLEKDEDVCSHNMVIVFLVSGKQVQPDSRTLHPWQLSSAEALNFCAAFHAQIICTVLIMGLQFERTYAILRYRRRLLKARHCDATAMEKGMEVPSDHWTAVASLDIFNETATTVSESQLFLFVMVGSSTVVATSAQIRNALRRFETFDGQLYVLQACCPECQPFETNCSCDLMCQISCAGLESCLTLNVGCMVCLMASLLFIPLAIWSPVADAAFQDPSNRSMHHLVLKRTRSLPIPVSILAAVTACGIALYAGNFMMTGLFRGRVLWHMVLVSNVAVAAAASFLLLWSTGFWRLVALPVYLIRICISAGQAALARSRAEFVAESKWASRLRKITTFWRSVHPNPLACPVSPTVCLHFQNLKPSRCGGI